MPQHIRYTLAIMIHLNHIFIHGHFLFLHYLLYLQILLIFFYFRCYIPAGNSERLTRTCCSHKMLESLELQWGMLGGS
jgi:hypothetical protein